MKSRRHFLQKATALTLGGALLSHTSWAESLFKAKKIPETGIQLFTILMQMESDPVGSLQKLAAAGYKNIESAFNKPGSFYGKKPKEFKALVHDMGMEWRSHHVVGSPMKPPPNFKIPNGPDGKPMSFPNMMTLKDNGQELVDLVAEAGIPTGCVRRPPAGRIAEAGAVRLRFRPVDASDRSRTGGTAFRRIDRDRGLRQPPRTSSRCRSDALAPSARQHRPPS